MMYQFSRWIAIALITTLSLAQFPPQPEGVTLLELQDLPGVSISYKETFICEPNARAWAGYVHMPTSFLSDIETAEPYNISMFFWYFEARKDPQNAPTTIYLAGGPGDSSVSGAVSDGGPCTVLMDSNSTLENPWSWNTYSNMLYIDQPVSTGFSYTKKVNSTLDLLFLGQPVTQTGITPFEAYGKEENIPAENTTFLYGTFSEQNPQKTANTTLTASKTLWHFSQAWFSSFPEYKRRCQNKNVNIFGNSYGGYWVPVTADYFLRQNEKIGRNERKGTVIPVDTVGWTNGCVDQLIQGEYYPDQAYNNTYDLQVIPQPIYAESKKNFTKPGGCRDLILECRRAGEIHDPDFLGTSQKVNELCLEAEQFCQTYVVGAYDVLSNRSDYDMAHLKPDPFPTSYWYGFLNREWVLRELGVPVNFTSLSLLANNVFLYGTGDPIRASGLPAINSLLDSGVKVAMMYGDRDYRCPWNGAEQLSLAARWDGSGEFESAGYEFVRTNETYRGGVVRQYDGLSFTRIFEAGHDAQAYQPETVFRLFNRAILGKDLATGEQSSEKYATSGPSSSFHIKNELPKPPPFNCNLYNVISSCTLQQYEALVNGTAKVVDFNIVKPAGGEPGGIIRVL